MTVQGMPDVAPAYGPETARAIANIIDLNPKLHDQTTFASRTSCGTQHCIAGWAWVLHKGEFTHDQVYVEDAKEYPTVPRLEEFGAEVLGISFSDSQTLFYDLNDGIARRALDVIANGGDLKAFYQEVFGE